MIECVAFFYNEGAKGDDFIQKNKFRCQVDSDTTKSLVKLRNLACVTDRRNRKKRRYSPSAQRLPKACSGIPLFVFSFLIG